MQAHDSRNRPDRLGDLAQILAPFDFESEACIDAVGTGLIYSAFNQMTVDLSDRSFDFAEEVIRGTRHDPKSVGGFGGNGLPFDFDQALVHVRDASEALTFSLVDYDSSSPGDVPDNVVTGARVAALRKMNHEIPLFSDADLDFVLVQDIARFLGWA